MALAPQRRRLLPLLLALAALAFIAAGVGLAQTLAARGHLLRGAAETGVAVAALRDPLQLTGASRRVALQQRLERARGEFAQARRDLSPWEPLLAHLGWLPGYGPQLQAAGPVADASYRTSDAALRLIAGLAPALTILQDRTSGERLPRLTAALAGQQPQFVAAQRDMVEVTRDIKRLPRRVGNRRLDALLRRLRTGTTRLAAATTWLALTPDLLGAHHPARYLLVWQDPAELRATGGFLGASDLLTVDHGRLTHHFYGNQLPREITWPPMPLPEEMYTPESNWLFVDSNWSPDFPLSARFERWFYGEDTGQWAGGVIDFLDTATPDLLRATGPVFLPRYHLRVNAQNVTPLAQRFVNHNYRGPDNSAAADVRRKAFLYAVLQALLQRVQHLPLARLPSIAHVLSGMIARREVLAYDRQPTVEAAIRGVRAAGRLLPGSGDYLFIVDDNRSYNKLNPYVREEASEVVTVTRSLALDETLTLRYHVAPSPADLEGGGPNWGLWGSKHDYQDFLRVYVPLGARLESMTGLDPWAPRLAYGVTQLAGRLLLREGHSATVVIRYRVPANVFAAGGGHEYRLKVQHQPGADLHRLQVTVRAGAGVVLGRVRRAVQATLPLATDAHLTLSVAGHLAPRPVSLPRAPAQPDPYIPFAALRDPRHPL